MTDDPGMPAPVDPRVYFAAERTLLAWIRTGMAMMGFGFVVARFGLFLREFASVRDVPAHAHGGLSLWAGTTLVILGVVVNVVAVVTHRNTIRRLQSGLTLSITPWSMGAMVALILALLGLLMAFYLVIGLEH